MGITKTIAEINEAKPPRSRLTAISVSDKKGKFRVRYLNCICICGNNKVTSIGEIISGGTLSCGCLSHENLIKRNTKFAINNHKINVCYLDMIRRCYNPKSANYKFYGAKGVSVCDEWKNNYESFINWALQNGWGEGLVLDKDIKGNGSIYSPETCSFVTRQENRAAVKINRGKDGRYIVTPKFIQ